jgi:hypothetical protein
MEYESRTEESAMEARGFVQIDPRAFVLLSAALSAPLHSQMQGTGMLQHGSNRNIGGAR